MGSGPNQVNPVQRIPYSPSRHFVGRTSELERLHKSLQTTKGAVITAISGMGGLGKTELAVQYVTRYRQTYPGGVCWLTARQQDLAAQILEKATLGLGLEVPQEVRGRTLSAAEQVTWCWEHWQPAGQVLVVLDDVTDWATCQPFMPTEERFRLLLTTREQNIARQFVPILLDFLQPSEARDLLARLEQSRRVEREPEIADRLCAALGYLPLGIELVGRYLAADRFLSLTQMWERLQAQGVKDAALKRQANYPMTAQLGARTAFELTWEQLDEVARTVARLLSLFAPDAIPWWLVEQIMQRQYGEKFSTRAAQAQLDNASVVQTKEENLDECLLHPLIREFLREKQQVTVKATGDQGLQRAFVLQVIEIAQAIPPSPTSREIRSLIPLRAHLQEIAEHHTAELEVDQLLWAFIGPARLYAGQGLYTQAEPWYQSCLKIVQARYTGDHPAVAFSLNNLAVLYNAQGRLSEAEPLLQQALEMRQRLFEEDHPAVADSLNNLAGFYKVEGRLSEAEPLLQQALEMRQRLFEEDHPAVADSLNNLAVLYKAQGRLNEAEPLLQQALNIYEQALGRDHPKTQITRSNLASLHQLLQAPAAKTHRQKSVKKPCYWIRLFIQRIKGNIPQPRSR